ncbi:unnamed protein product [Meloidogyne enterolobii]|uniref:Uncharacterized protein n=1 Tax=Meloidogyne enterolobii TaxID=390850 RepID=A0ACB0XNA6_MELEN
MVCLQLLDQMIVQVRQAALAIDYRCHGRLYCSSCSSFSFHIFYCLFSISLVSILV